MRVRRVVLLTREHAVLHLRPSWLARLFGAPDLIAELEYEKPNWVSKYTRTSLSHMHHSSLINEAMQAYPICDAPIPTARLLEEGHAGLGQAEDS